MNDALIPSHNFKHAPSGYRVWTRLPEPLAEKIVGKVLNNELDFTAVLKDKSKCLVALFDQADVGKLVLKVPRDRNGRLWERILTLFRQGESVRQYQNMEALESLGLKGPAPVLAAEKRQNGLVIDSFYIYTFIEGREGRWTDLGLIVDTLIPLYRMGFCRTDPRVANHIINGNEVFLIDFRVKRPVPFNGLRCAMEYSRLVNDYEAALKIGDYIGTPRWVAKLAWHLQRLNLNIRKAKHALRRLVKQFPG